MRLPPRKSGLRNDHSLVLHSAQGQSPRSRLLSRMSWRSPPRLSRHRCRRARRSQQLPTQAPRPPLRQPRRTLERPSVLGVRWNWTPEVEEGQVVGPHPAGAVSGPAAGGLPCRWQGNAHDLASPSCQPSGLADHRRLKLSSQATGRGSEPARPGDHSTRHSCMCSNARATPFSPSPVRDAVLVMLIITLDGEQRRPETPSSKGADAAPNDDHHLQLGGPWA